MFSPSVSSPLTFMPGSGLKPLNCSISSFARFWNSASSAGFHQSRSLPSPSKRRPWSSKPWPISWPITAPIAP